MSTPQSAIDDAVTLGSDDGGELLAMPMWPTDSKGDTQQIPGGVRALAQASDTPTPTYGPDSGEVSLLRRHSGGRHGRALGRLDPKSFALNSAELSTTVKKFRDEMYRNQFPVLVPEFEARCTACGAEYDAEPEVCERDGCDSTAFEEPAQEQKRAAKEFFRSVNREGQSLRALLEYEEDYQSFHGVSVIIARMAYERVAHETRVGTSTRSRTVEAKVDDSKGLNGVVELVHADSRTVVPITDANDRHGGAWICPFHRETYYTSEEVETDADGEVVTACPQCETQLQEAGYAETSGLNGESIEHLYLTHEVIDWARHFPEHNGLDGRSPVLPMVKLQAIIQFNRDYEIGVMNAENTDRFPNKMILAYGKNIKQKLSASVDENSDKAAWETGQVFYDGEPDGIEIQIEDLTPGAVLDNRQSVIERQQSQIRAAFGVSDAMENELSDAGGLNAEGTQIEITNRAIASAHQDTEDKALTQLREVLGLSDWKIKYVDPKREKHELGVDAKINAIAAAQQAGIKWEVSDGELVIPDQSDADAGGGDEGGAPQPDQQAFTPDRKLSARAIQKDPKLIDVYKQRYSGQTADQTCRYLERCGQACLWPDGVDEKLNAPGMNRDEEVPQFAEQLIDDAIDGGAVRKPEGLTNTEHLKFEDLLREKLQQPQGWSVDSIANDIRKIAPRSEPEERELWATNAVQNVLNQARTLGYAVADPPLDERWFYLGGPMNANICEVCQRLVNETNPHRGGTPMRWNELLDYLDDVNDEEFPGTDNSAGQIHINCCHFVSEFREARGESRGAL